MIDKSFFTPFIEAVQNTLENLLGERPKASEAGLINSTINTEKDYFLDISGIMALSSRNIIGSLLLSFFNLDAEVLASRLTGKEKIEPQDLSDAILELVNLIGGKLKTSMGDEFFDFTTPYISKGSLNPLSLSPGFECYSVYFEVQDLSFILKISFFNDAEVTATSVLNNIDEYADDKKIKTVLIVDDSAIARKMIKQEIGEDAFEFIEAENGEQAISLAVKHLPSVITMDIEMPGMNGFDTCLRLRENAITSNIPIVIITARRDIQAMEQGFYVGSVEFFSKPLVKNELHDFLLDLLFREKRKEATVLLIEDNHITRYNERYILNRFGYEVLEARNIKEAEKYFERNDISCIVTEFSTPVEHSIATIEKLSKSPYFKFVPVICCTDNRDRVSIKKAFEAGAIDFITKPFIIEEYLARVKTAVLRKRSVDEIQEKNIKLENVISMRDKYFSFIVHELRTPLNSIVNFINMKNKNLIAEDETEEIDSIINDELFGLSELINNILDISRTENDDVALNLEDVEVSKLVLSALELLRVLSKVKCLELKLNIPENLVITADKIKFKGIIINLLSNAIKYTDEGYVELGYSKEGNNHIFYVKDTGIGIPKGYEDKIFQEYRRVTDKTEVRGTGIGLALVKKYIDAHKGSIKVESFGHGKGSIFTFAIPENISED
jgi:signal transduction histidine kinase/CheY-specific phosphatase CheX